MVGLRSRVSENVGVGGADHAPPPAIAAEEVAAPLPDPGVIRFCQVSTPANSSAFGAGGPGPGFSEAETRECRPIMLWSDIVVAEARL